MNVRDETMKNILGEEVRVQYDDKDEARIERLAGMFTQASMLMLQALGAYSDAMKAPVDENSADLMKGARHDLVYAWTTAQGATSAIAVALRFDGDEAFARSATAAEKNEDVNLNDL